MRWHIYLSILLIIGGGAFVAWYGVSTFDAVFRSYGESVADEEQAVEQLIENTELASRLIPLLSGGAALGFGVILAVREAVRARRGGGATLYYRDL
ncbi:MAG: hypothetical protein ACYTAN_07710 [Planctomycetota bacterium]|jgi:hypothetical protein